MSITYVIIIRYNIGIPPLIYIILIKYNKVPQSFKVDFMQCE